jgi:NAD(P)-dependent dehydrogenase (short-subunit alcohol dehydrogenase family)
VAAHSADVTKNADPKAMVEVAQGRWGRIDVLHYNVGVSLAGGDAPLLEITEAAFDNVVAINLRGAVMACKHVIPVMRDQKSGAIINIPRWPRSRPIPMSPTSDQVGMIAFTEQLAYQNAQYGIRARHPAGLMNTPMAVDTRARVGKSRAPSRPSAMPFRCARRWHRLGRR